MLYCRLIYMLSILCVILTIKVKVGIPESFKVGWYPPQKKTGSSHLQSLSNVRGKGDSSSCKYGKAHIKGSQLCNCISYGGARRRGEKKYLNLQMLQVQIVTVRGRKEHRGLPLLSLTKLVVFKFRGSALQSAFEIIDFTGRCD